MAAIPSTDKDRLNRRSDTSGVSPIPSMKFPPLPPRIAQIDPQGASEFTRQLEQNFADWVQKLNVVTSGLAGQIKP